MSLVDVDRVPVGEEHEAVNCVSYSGEKRCDSQKVVQCA